MSITRLDLLLPPHPAANEGWQGWQGCGPQRPGRLPGDGARVACDPRVRVSIFDPLACEDDVARPAREAAGHVRLYFRCTRVLLAPTFDSTYWIASLYAMLARVLDPRDLDADLAMACLTARNAAGAGGASVYAVTPGLEATLDTLTGHRYLTLCRQPETMVLATAAGAAVRRDRYPVGSWNSPGAAIWRIADGRWRHLAHGAHAYGEVWPDPRLADPGPRA